MYHDVLGEIKRSEERAGEGVATVKYRSRDIEIQIDADDQPFESAVKLAAEVASRLGELDDIAKQVIANELRETYNDGWNSYNEAQEDGTFKLVTNPQLSEAEFKEKFSLVAIYILGSEMTDLFYEDSGLFWGHSVIVNFRDGANFKDAWAELFG